MAHAYHEPKRALSLGVVEVRRDDGSIVAVGSASLMNDRDGAIDFAATASVMPEPGIYTLRMPTGAESVATLLPASARFRMRLALGR